MLKKTIKNPIHIELFPLILLLGFLPLVSHLVLINTKLIAFPWFPNQEQRGDFFLYEKGKVFILLVILMIILFFDQILIQRKKILFSKKFIPLLIYAVFCVLSTLLSKNKYFSFHGFVEQYETIWVLLGYVVAAYYSYFVVKSENEIKILLYSLYVCSAVLGLLGLLQLFHMDFFASTIGKYILVSNDLKQYRASIMFNFENTKFNRVYMSLYNPNYVGTYVSLVFPIVFLKLFTSKKKSTKIAFLCLSLVLFIDLLGSGSKTAFLVLPIVLFLAVMFFSKKLLLKKKYLFLGLILIVFSIMVYNQLTNHSFLTRFKDSLEFTKKEYSLTEIQPEKTNVTMTYNNTKFYFNSAYDANNQLVLNLWDEDNENVPLNYNESGSNYIPQDDRLTDFSFSTYAKDGIVYLIMEHNKIKWRFTNNAGKDEYQYVTLNGKIDEIIKAPSTFQGYETILTFRGYIWGRTIPLLKHYLFYGAGPDQFALVFPQNDYVMRSNMSYGFFTETLTKPHNLYLQIAVQTGVLSLLCFLFFCGSYLLWSCKLYFRKNKYNYCELTGASIFLGITGYLLCGITNDSCLSVAPVFWVLFGMGFAINAINSRTK